MIVTVGELMWDLLAERGVPLERAPRLQPVVGGAAGNVALELASMGASVAVATAVSADPWGEALVGALSAAGVDVEAIVRHPGRTGTVIIERTKAEHERYVSFRPDWGPSYPRLELPAAGSRLHIAAVDPDPSQIEVWITLATEMRRRGGLVVVDLNARTRAWRDQTAPVPGVRKLLGLTSLCKASDRDLELHRLAAAPAELATTARALGLPPTATLVVTRGGHPAQAVGPFGRVDRTPPPTALERSVGAGDAFCAYLLHHVGPAVPCSASTWGDLLEGAHAHAARRMALGAEEARP